MRHVCFLCISFVIFTNIVFRKNLSKYSVSWLGASRPCNSTNSGSSFFWMDNSNLGSWSYWDTFSLAPNNFDLDNTNIQQNCVIMEGNSNFYWDDKQCNQLHSIVCQYRITASIFCCYCTLRNCSSKNCCRRNKLPVFSSTLLAQYFKYVA